MLGVKGNYKGSVESKIYSYWVKVFHGRKQFSCSIVSHGAISQTQQKSDSTYLNTSQTDKISLRISE